MDFDRSRRGLTLAEVARREASRIVDEGINTQVKAGLPRPSYEERAMRVRAAKMSILDMVFDGQARVEGNSIVFEVTTELTLG